MLLNSVPKQDQEISREAQLTVLNEQITEAEATVARLREMRAALLSGSELPDKQLTTTPDLDERYLVPEPGSDRAETGVIEEGSPRSPMNFNELSDLVGQLKSDPEIVIWIAEYNKHKAELMRIHNTPEYRKAVAKALADGTYFDAANRSLLPALRANLNVRDSVYRMQVILQERLSALGIRTQGIFERELGDESFLVKSLGMDSHPVTYLSDFREK